ncbi:MAG TPA: peptidylprolyl isomerase [bacterium]|nr:peptidylprolyl isomerase [bacterium]
MTTATVTVGADKVVFIHYTLSDEAGQVIDSTLGDEPLAYLHGHANLIPGLERALDGRAEGEVFEVLVAPEDAYGAHDPAGLIDVPRSSLSEEVEIAVGNQVQAQGPEGRMEFTIVAFDDEMVTLDGNHPLAGMALHFAIEVGTIREAHPDEIKHHRVHPAGHHVMVADSSFDEGGDEMSDDSVVDAVFADTSPEATAKPAQA